MALCRMCVALELSTLAPSQYTWKMAGLAEVAGVGYGGDEDGFYKLEGADDAGVNISASIKLPTTDFGILNQKRMRCLYLGYECDHGELQATVVSDETHSMTKTFKSTHLGKSIGQKITVDRDIKGRYFDVEINNLHGCDFTINAVDALILQISGKAST